MAQLAASGGGDDDSVWEEPTVRLWPILTAQTQVATCWYKAASLGLPLLTASGSM